MAVVSIAKCFAGLLTLRAALGSPVKNPRSYPTGYPSSPILKEGQLGAVASEAEICSHIGTDLLKAGGNAADALVGTVACVGVVGMYHSGKLDPKDEPFLALSLTTSRIGWRRIYACQSAKWNL